MLANPSPEGTVAKSTPLLEVKEQEETRNQGGGWWNKVLDLEETKKQLLFSLPIILASLFYFLITLVSAMLAGDLGELQLAGATLANSWNNVTGVAVMVGLSGALETLCGQGFGAEKYEMLGTYLQSSCIISFIFSITISITWFHAESILVLLHQSQDIARTAALYMKFLIPGLFAFGFLENILSFVQTQSVAMPLVVLSGLPLMVHIVIAYALVHCTGLRGAPVAVSISLWLSAVLLALYVVYANKFKQTWKGFTFPSFHYILTVLKLALPSAAMTCLEDWASEILVLLAGLLSNSEVTTSVIGLCINTELIAYTIAWGLRAAASTRVSNELGAGHPDRAKQAMNASLKLCLVLSFCVVLALALGHGIWIGLFTNSARIKEEFASMVPFLAISMLLDSVQCVLSGVARGCGWQHLVVYINLANFYLIGLPISCLLGFKYRFHAKGLWIGLICGLFCQTGTLLLLTKYAKWTKMSMFEDSKRGNSPVA